MQCQCYHARGGGGAVVVGINHSTNYALPAALVTTHPPSCSQYYSTQYYLYIAQNLITTKAINMSNFQ